MHTQGNADTIEAVMSRIVTDNAVLQQYFVDEIPCLDADAVAAMMVNNDKIVSLVSVPWGGTRIYPAFQFEGGRSKPVIAKILAALPAGMSPWQVAFWFVSSNPALGGRVPFESLSDIDAVVRAARAEGDLHLY